MTCSCSRKKGKCKQITELIKNISIGKYSTKLYYNGRGFKGSMATGIFTIIYVLLLVSYAGLVFSDIFNCENYSLDLVSFEI
jgi:hypothetical protein